MLKKLHLIFLFCLLSLFFNAYAESTLALQVAPTLDAKFITVQCAKPCKKPVKSFWWMMRDKNQVEVRALNHQNALDEHSEIWRFSPTDGKMAYLYLMHDEKRVIEYLHEDMSLLQMSPSQQKWQEFSALISEKDLASLKQSAKKLKGYLGNSAEQYTGKLNGTKVKVIWMPELHIPYQIQFDYPKASIKITLQSIAKADSQQAQAPRTTESHMSTYNQVYYTDIGDMEQNAEDKIWIRKAHGAPGLGAHQH